MVSLSSFAQDIIARQAPSDKRLKDIHNVKLNSKLGFSAADLNDPASNIYTDWTDNLRSCSGSVPSNYKIDLRGFCMPTPSRKINSPSDLAGDASTKASTLKSISATPFAPHLTGKCASANTMVAVTATTL